MKIDKNTFKQPQTWAVIVPAILFLWVLGALIAMNQAQAASDKQLASAEKVQADARMIVDLMQEIGAVNISDAMSRQFDPITSVRACAKAAFIPESKLPKGESFKSKVQSDGSLLTRESYRLSGVRLLQVARFIDHAERDYSSVSCTQLAMTHARSKQKDSWDVTLDLQYITR